MSRSSLVLVVSSAAALLAACQASTATAFSDADRAAIRQSEEQWVQLSNAKDWMGATRAYWAPDAAILPPNGPEVRGHDAIAAWLQAYPPFTDFSLPQVSVDGRGDLAYVHGKYSIMVMLPGAAAPTKDDGKHVTVWKKQPDGTWRAILGIFNSDLALPTPTRPRR